MGVFKGKSNLQVKTVKQKVSGISAFCNTVCGEMPACQNTGTYNYTSMGMFSYSSKFVMWLLAFHPLQLKETLCFEKHEQAV